MRILFSFVGGFGHGAPMFPIARAAADAGHTVAFTNAPAIVDAIEANGFTSFPSGPPHVAVPNVAELQPLDEDREERALRESFAGWMAQGRADDVDALIDEWGADVVVCDEVDFGAMTAAARRGTAHVTVLVLPTGSFLRPELLDAVSAPRPALVLAPFPPSLRDPAFPLPDGARTVRPDVGPASDRRDLLYVTLGTIFNTESGDLFDRLLAAVADLDIEVVATVGRAIDPARFGPQPDHVRIERFVPQSSLLPRCRAVVSHGGSGSVVGALAHGAPLVCIPLGADQPHNARRCDALGVGRTLDAVAATPADIRAAIERVVTDPSFRMKAAELQEESAALPPPSAAVAAIEACVR